MILMASMLLSFVACVEEEPASIEFKGGEFQMLVGEVKDLAPELEVKNTIEKPEWVSSDEALATVTQEGEVTALEAGEVTITASIGNLTATCVVVIAEVKAESIVVNAPKSMTVGNPRSVTVTVKPEGYDTENLVWEFTPSDDALEFDATKVSASEYTVSFKSFVKGGKLTVKVSDSNSSLSQTAEIEAAKDGVPATSVSLVMPDQLTETISAIVKAVVEPASYEAENLEWTFTPTSSDLGFTYEKINDFEYKVAFSSYVRNGSVSIMVADAISQNFAQGDIAVRPFPTEGVTSLSLSPETLRLKLDDQPYTMKVLTEPADYDPMLLKWTSEDENVVTVSDGVLTIVGEGKTNVTVQDVVSKKEATCQVAVVQPNSFVDVKRIDLDCTNLDMRVGDKDVQLTAICYDEAGNVVENYSDLVWSAAEVEVESGMISVVEVSQQGVVTAKNAGSTIVTVTDKVLTNIKAICHVTVAPAPIKVQQVKLAPEAKIISSGRSYKVEAAVSPEDAEDKTLKYTSSDPKVATVDAEGNVTGVANGTAYIRATATNGVYGECEVTVTDAWVDFGISKITLVVGEERTMTAKVMPETLEAGSMTWSSSSQNVVSVDQNGNIKGLAAGEADVKVVTSKGVEGTCKVTVMNDFNILFKINENITRNGIHQFESFEMSAEYSNDYVPESYSWEVSDASALKLTEQGDKVLVEVVYEGRIDPDDPYVVTITHKVGKKEKSQDIKILTAVPKQIILTSVPEVNGVKYKMMHRDVFKFEAKILPEQASQDVRLQGGGHLDVVDNTYKATEVGLQYFTIYAQGHTEVRYDFSVEVLPIPLTELIFSQNEVELQAGAQASLAVTYVPEDASYQNLEWKSSDESVAVVDAHGVITAVAAGSAVITAVQANNNVTQTCNVTVVSAASAGPAVGDYYYSDGTTSSELDASKTVIGVVFSVNNPAVMGDAELVADYPECVNGYVVSTVEYEEQDWGSVSAYSGHGYYNGIGYDANLIVDQDKANGYGNSLAHRDLNASKSDYCTMFNATAGVIATHTAAVEAPSSASLWYVPSYKEMQMLTENREAVNVALEAAGGTKIAEPYEVDDSSDAQRSSDWYWTSTIHGTWYESGRSYDHSKYPFDLSKCGWTANVQSFAKCKVRIILAF